MNKQTAEKIIHWYEENKRDLPWRDTGDPYAVWVSEIMLQQTRIEAVREKYMMFMKELPDIPSLASCDPDKLMRLWEGLGYYSRARNLQKCAQVLVQKYDGKLPDTYEELLSLPGIGAYTAGAIASAAFSRPVPAVDGNVLRVLARVHGIEEDIRDEKTVNRIRELLLPVYTEDIDYGSCNQGLMELGETVCLPRGTCHCDVCPLHTECIACHDHSLDRIPYRSKLKPRRIEERTLLVIQAGDRFLVRQRPHTGLLAGLWEFPSLSGFRSENEVIQALEKDGMHTLKIRTLPEAVHIFTHLEWHMHAYEVQIKDPDTLPEHTGLYNKRQLRELALPSAFRVYTDYYDLR
ncbi:MAG: A/G-specific adenine glycosylase [Solobacterium sp.]|nr:A/G-specific adenine glycosylase [Solobacterium sp.]